MLKRSITVLLILVLQVQASLVQAAGCRGEMFAWLQSAAVLKDGSVQAPGDAAAAITRNHHCHGSLASVRRMPAECGHCLGHADCAVACSLAASVPASPIDISLPATLPWPYGFMAATATPQIPDKLFRPPRMS